MSPLAPVLFEVADLVGRVTLNRPGAMNTYDVAMTDALAVVLDEAEAREDVRAIVLTGAEPAFCGGADIRLILRAIEDPALLAEAEHFVAALHACLLRVHSLTVPTLCAVNGACAGGAVGMALACDLTWAAESASFTAAFAGIGLTPDTGTSYFLPRAVGERAARELLMTNRRVEPDEALRLGLVSRVLPDGELLDEAIAVAQRLAQGPTPALVRARELIDRSARSDLASHLDAERESVLARLATEDLAEGVRAFLEKRRPQFSGD